MIKSVAILDFETTGRDPVTCLVIEGAVASYAVMPDGTLGHPIDSYAELNDPSFPLPQEIIRLTGITDDMLKGRTLDWKRFEEVSAGAELIIAHNAKFDRQIAERAGKIFLPRWACSME